MVSEGRLLFWTIFDPSVSAENDAETDAFQLIILWDRILTMDRLWAGKELL